MKNNTKIIYISQIIITMAIFVLIFTISNPSYAFRIVIIHAFLGISFVILLQSFGWKKDNGYLKSTAIRSLISLLLSYIIIIYSIGIILGFTKGYSAGSLNYFKSLASTILFILQIEAIRYLVIKNSLNTKAPIIIFTILSIIISVILEININNLITSEDKFIFLSTIIFPIISEELLCDYLTYKVSLVPSIIFKMVLKLYFYVIPIVPDLGNYLYSAINVLFPYIVFMVINRIIVKYEKIKASFRKTNTLLISVPLVLLFSLLVILVSGLFKYKMIAIGSNSMHPTYNRGDAIIFEKVGSEEIELGDILVFTRDGKIITHRVVKKNYSNGDYHFNTKGDNNETKDAFVTNSSNVLGRVVFKTKYIGYPTVLINEFFERSK